MHCYGFLSRGFTDRRKILHGGSAWSQTGFLLFRGGYSPRDGQILGVNRAPYGGICFLLRHLFCSADSCFWAKMTVGSLSCRTVRWSLREWSPTMPASTCVKHKAPQAAPSPKPSSTSGVRATSRLLLILVLIFLFKNTHINPFNASCSKLLLFERVQCHTGLTHRF